MNKRTLTALQGSIKKWEGILKGTVKDEGVDNCPLCKKFYDNLCEGCPVSERTGERYCGGSPYDNIWSALYEYEREEMSDNARAAAEAELAFLRSLLSKTDYAE